MPRQRGGPARAPARPSTAPPPRAAPTQQSRSASTASVPARTAQPPVPVQQAQAPASQGPGLFGQMASTAAGVAVGSTVGHMVGAGITGLFGGGGNSAPAAEAQQALPPAESRTNQWQDGNIGINCDADVKSFNKCMNDHQDVTICQWYLDKLKACQDMAKHY